ncbi:MAG: class I SAM-dependent methyltransferase [Sphingobacteriales bacterium]|nr:class I SAM-dependent methyltransferase [Sphingobacteriales bacterium]
METKNCPLGCVPLDIRVMSGEDILHGKSGVFHIVKCSRCGLMRTNPRPSPEEMGRYYPDDYKPFLTTLINSEEVIQAGIKAKLVSFLRGNSKMLPYLKPGKMLEIGCASGAYLNEMSKKGWQVQGIEFSPIAADNAKKEGYQVYTGAIETAPQPDTQFDLITGWMVMEHLHEPLEVLRRLNNWTKKDGYFVFSVPDAASWEFQYFKDKWFAQQLPTHLFHYTVPTLKKLLNESGWVLEKVIWHKNPNNFLKSMLYKAQASHNKSREVFLNKIIRGEKLNVLHLIIGWLMGITRQSGRMTIWARKI